MTPDPKSAIRTHSIAFDPRAERGVVLFIALLVMVALSLAGIALIRSADTATIVAGNLAFKQAAASAVDRGIEQAIEALFKPADPSAPAIADKTAHLPAQNYYACVQDAAGGCLPANAPIPEVPAMLTTKSKIDAAISGGLLADALFQVDDAGNKVYYVIERMCNAPGAASAGTCNLSASGLGSDAGTQHYESLGRPGDAYYRVTVRVEGPRSTVAYAQAILR